MQCARVTQIVQGVARSNSCEIIIKCVKPDCLLKIQCTQRPEDIYQIRHISASSLNNYLVIKRETT